MDPDAKSLNTSLRSQSDAQDVFKRVFNQWYDGIKTNNVLQKRVRDLLTLFEKEKAAIARQKKAGQVVYAYFEDELGLTSIDHVGSSHGTNQARVTDGLPPNVAHETTAEFLFNTMKLKNRYAA